MDPTLEKNSLLKNSSFFRECVAERDAIDAHWQSIRKENRPDVTFEEAVVDWMLRKRGAWRANRSRPGPR